MTARLRLVLRLVALALLLPAGAPARADAFPPPSVVAAEIRGQVDGAAARGVAGEPVMADALRRVYELAQHEALWHARPEAEADAREIEARLRAAGDHGLDTGDLHLPALARLQGAGDARALAERDVLLTDALLRHAVKLRQGSVPEDAFGQGWSIEADDFLPADGLIQAVRERSVASWLDALEPADPQYRRLIGALRHYRGIAALGGWPIVPGDEELKLDGDDPRLPVLRERLGAEGDLPDGARDAPALLAAVQRFQARHGLDPDGRIGAATLAALHVTADHRAAQIAANLERWRRLPRRADDVYVEVNVADATLTLVEHGVPVLTTRVIVGDVRHRTPVLAATITGITLNPFWNVPRSIATREMLPRLRRDPAYLAANQIAIIERPDDPFGKGVDWRSLSAAGFPYRLRQFPGAKNSLGRIKFEMPNALDVYLHDTPGKALFRRQQRAFSHGCVRVEHAPALALRLLERPDWDRAALDAAVATGENRRLTLSRPVPVYLLYWTALVDDAGRASFRPDLYGRDFPLIRALRFHAPGPAAATAEALPAGHGRYDLLN
ncbi:MAG: L,D-transpeptidase family protein [Alphaproteobacteria bacterium]|nr:L,D-transpeptidase family protein [Alphaproteobacteria bacterium]